MTPQGRVFIRARKRRSARDLDRWRQRQTTFQANQTTPSEAELEQHLRHGFGVWQQQQRGGCFLELSSRTEEKCGAKQYHTKYKCTVSTPFSDLVGF
jgi:hypothetical protein